MRDARLDVRGSIINKPIQLLAYADDVDIITKSLRKTKEKFSDFANAAENMGLKVSGAKTKFMAVTSKNRVRDAGQNITIDDYNFEAVEEFIYLGSSVGKNNTKDEINRRILLANKCYYGLSKHLRSQILSRKTKIQLYKTLIVPVLTYGSETWTMTQAEEQALLTFERKILRRIFGGVCENGLWRRRYNYELYDIFKNYEGRDIITFIKVGRLRWAGHIIRSQENNPINKVFNIEPVGKRRQGRPKLRWKDGVDRDARKIGALNWKIQARNRGEWRKKLEKVEVQFGL